MRPQNIAVIGSGISGLSAAWLLDKAHNVTLFEKNDRLGGHTNTFEMDINGNTVPVDTGFICFNSVCYPNLIAFFDHLSVPQHETSMSFAASLNGGAYEYSGGTYLGLFGQPANFFKPAHWLMIRDILRFFKEAPLALDTLSETESLGAYLKRAGYSPAFAERHLLPMAAAIWSSKLTNTLKHPAKAFIQFFQNHGLLQVANRPRWGTVDGGSQIYIDRILDVSNIDYQTSCPVLNVKRLPSHVEVTTQLGTQQFDHVIFASHADQALSLLDQPSLREQSLLGAFDYTKNTAVLHQDRRLMPKRKVTWASWNYLDFAPKGQSAATSTSDLCLTYWMNSLQNLNTKEDVFVTLNPPEDIEIENIAAEFEYTHPVFDGKAMIAQKDLWSLQGVNRTWFCGAHFGSGFHEDGLQSGLAVAEQLGGVRRPWTVENESGRIFIHEPEGFREAAE